MADLITTCYGGRNRKCAEAFCRQRLAAVAADGRVDNNDNNAQGDDDSYGDIRENRHSYSTSSIKADCEAQWETIERKLLNGQKLQGTLTAKEVYALLDSRQVLDAFPLFETIYEISFLGRSVHDVVDGIAVVAPSSSAPVVSHL